MEAPHQKWPVSSTSDPPLPRRMRNRVGFERQPFFSSLAACVQSSGHLHAEMRARGGLEVRCEAFQCFTPGEGNCGRVGLSLQRRRGEHEVAGRADQRVLFLFAAGFSACVHDAGRNDSQCGHSRWGAAGTRRRGRCAGGCYRHQCAPGVRQLCGARRSPTVASWRTSACCGARAIASHMAARRAADISPAAAVQAAAAC